MTSVTTALILAGSRPGGDPLAQAVGVRHKALIEIGGTSMLAYVVAALRSAGMTRILVSTGDEAVSAAAVALGAEPVAAEAGPSGSAAAALALAGAPLLLTTADHPLLRPEWISDFLQAVPAEADVAVLLARQEAIERDAPPSRRTYLSFADGRWSGCNLFLLVTPAASRALDLWSHVERDRKRPWRIVRRLGLGMIWRYLTGRLTLAAAVARIGEGVGIKARIVAAGNGLAAVDVDSPGDLELVRGLLT
ncbi:nucleotidyltransferase family protein [Sphingomonas aerophila]|uniref:CTP:molybdopterin cytidylyltransferase MocA n=1 Tax=Sphingomonas aerophila TaxID=1344948 RepID=A0A7W9EXC2_9SPHN|nr:nucleotidyltransferase family protein [Sphingomonas aerophila]MBB5716662.1 CTP:molybdopterin cytidylyltransferase MocA [Sphingomonas aerophila]